MAAPTWTTGEVLASSDVNTWFVPIAAYKSADQTVTSSTTLVNDSALAITIQASSVYNVEMYIEYEGGVQGSSDLKFTWTLPNVTTFHYTNLRVNTSGQIATGMMQFGSDTVVAATNGSTRNGIMLKGVIFGATSSGVVQWRWAQNTSSGTGTTVHAGSYLLANRIA